MNGIGLEKYTKIIGKGMHGNHPAYDKYVKTQLDRFNKIGLTPEQANKFLQEELIFNKKVEQSRYAAGDAQTYPLDDKFIFIYENSARNTDLSHEVGHTLGLEHSFDEFKNKEGIVLTQKQRVQELELEIKRTKGAQDLKIKKDKLSIIKKNLHKYKEGKTSNMMDYTDYGVFDLKDFSHWQWKVMRDEVKKFYS